MVNYVHSPFPSRFGIVHSLSANYHFSGIFRPSILIIVTVVDVLKHCLILESSATFSESQVLLEPLEYCAGSDRQLRVVMIGHVVSLTCSTSLACVLVAIL